MEVFSQQLHLEAPLLKRLQTALGIEHFRDLLERPQILKDFLVEKVISRRCMNTVPSQSQ